MGKALEKLIDIGSSALVLKLDSRELEACIPPNNFGIELLELLKRKNGFFAFESALHIFPAQSKEKIIGLSDWNSADLWIGEYHGMANNCFFFAEDIFGGQFCMRSDGIYVFDPETGTTEFLAPDLEAWAKTILDDYEVLTGFPLAHEWQQSRGALQIGERLVPKIPFVTGGEFAIENLFVLEAVKAMRSRANLAVQIRDLPDGASIQWKITD